MQVEFLGGVGWPTVLCYHWEKGKKWVLLGCVILTKVSNLCRARYDRGVVFGSWPMSLMDSKVIEGGLLERGKLILGFSLLLRYVLNKF